MSKPHYLQLSTVRRFTVAEYHRMKDGGVIAEDEATELLEGCLLDMTPGGIVHDRVLNALAAAYPRFLPPGWLTRSRQSVVLTDSVPKPDIAVVRGDETVYRTRHPGPADIGLLVEVSDSSLLIDRDDKGSIYARERVPVYWVVNVVDKVVEVYTQPGGPAENPAYTERDDYPVGTAVPVVLDGAAVGTIAVADVMG